MKPTIRSIINLVVALPLVCACTTKSARLNDPNYVQQAENVVTPVRNDFEDLKKGAAPLVVPRAFVAAEESMGDTNAAYAKGRDIEQLQKSASVTSSKIEDAKNVSNSVAGRLKIVLDWRNKAIDAGATETQMSQLRRLDEDLKTLGGRIERNQPVQMGEITNMADAYKRLSSKAALSSLNDIRQEMQLAEKTGAKKLMPNRFNEVSRHFDDVQQFVSNYPNDKDGQDKQLADLETDFLKLKSQAEIARQISDLKPEESAIKIEAAISRLESASGANQANFQVVADQSWTTRLENVVGATEGALQAQNQLKNSEVQLSEANQKIQSLSGQAVMTEKMNQARDVLSESDADVLVSGRKMIIRLKTMKFASGKSEIPPDNFSSLNQLGQLITELQPGSVMVQGHTDSIGSRELNKALSEERAKAVEAFLAQSKSSSNTNFDFQGLGFEQPIASNKTPDGRAQNRRIDIILDFPMTKIGS